MPPKRTIPKETADAAAEPAAKKRSRVKKPKEIGNGERLPAMPKRTARTNKAAVDSEARKKEQREEANKRRNERAKALRAEKKGKEQEALNGEVEMAGEVLRAIESANATASAALQTFLGTVIALGELETNAAITSAVERGLDFQEIKGVGLKGLSKNSAELRNLAGAGVLAADAPVPEQRGTNDADQGDDELHCRPKDTSKPHTRGANTGGCGRTLTNENQPVDCHFDRCEKVKFCTDCKENQKKGILMHLDGKQAWFCSEHCIDTHTHEAEEKNARADKDDAAKNVRTRESRKNCACGNKFSNKNPDSGCARKEACTRAHACYECVRSGRSTRGVSGKFDVTLLRQEWFCSGSCYYETYPEEDGDETEYNKPE
ncbi:hypothetical protein Vi05172_g11208 [Venturia inaequalis]|nr:hypothetical protein Vi05172_g11208 [Venturia inaequalis]